jgi:hypothetical protein
MHCEPSDYNNKEQRVEHIYRVVSQQRLEPRGNMVDFVYVDEVGFDVHLRHPFGNAR